MARGYVRLGPPACSGGVRFRLLVFAAAVMLLLAAGQSYSTAAARSILVTTVTSALLKMVGYLSVVLNLVFVLLLRGMLQAAEQSNPHFRMLWLLVLGAGGTLVILSFYLAKIRRIEKGGGAASTQIRQ